jgi:hypothetical protein
MIEVLYPGEKQERNVSQCRKLLHVGDFQIYSCPNTSLEKSNRIVEQYLEKQNKGCHEAQLINKYSAWILGV